MIRVVINGKFATESMQGIVRYAQELLAAFDEVLEPDDEAVLVVPKGAEFASPYKRIRVEEYGALSGIAWEQIDLARYMFRHREYTLLNLCNVAPILSKPGVTAIHDVMYRACPQFYLTARNRVSRLWHCMQYALITRREAAILTVSEFSKREIERYYPKAAGKVWVVPDAWQHVQRIAPAPDWRDRYPQLVPGEYLFSMATLARNKNGRWIYEVARNNPSLTFAIAGSRYESDEIQKPDNVVLLGYVSDEDACALIQNCRAFIFPSFYEGFGLPPLEALALGAEVISSNTTSLPEVMGNAAHYIDPTVTDVDLDELLGTPVGPARDQLAKYSWASSSRILKRVLRG